MSRSGHKRSFIPSVVPPLELCEPALWFVFSGDRLLVTMKAGAGLPICARDLREVGFEPIRQHYLGAFDGSHCYCAEVVENVEGSGGMTLHGLRDLWGLLDEDLLAISGYAKQIIHWDRTSRFCGQCGEHLVPETERRVKICPRCHFSDFPRISPAIIVAVVKANKLLLVRSHSHPPGLYSVVAGFVEPGETLEDCVQREVKEETGVDVKSIRYFGSQPWPFPNSLMVAFVAEYAGHRVIIEKSEIEDAGWFSPDEFPQIPPPITIARQLIDWFVTLQRGNQ